MVKLLEPRSNSLIPHLAMKQFKDRVNWPTAKIEARILRELSHKNIIKMDSLYKHRDKVYLLLEYFDAPNLSEVIRQRKGQSFEEGVVCRIIKQLVEALAHCHQRGIYHLDVKPENILVNEQWRIKLIDFAFSVKMVDQSKIKKYCGTPTYMAPEILKKESYYPQKADSWSVGIVAFRLFTGKAPFKGKKAEEILEKVNEYSLDKTLLKHASKEFKEFLNKTMRRNHENRFSMKELLNLPFLKNCSV